MVCNNQCPNDFYPDASVQQCPTTTAATTTLTTESTQTTSTLAPSNPVSNETDGVPDTTTGASRVQVFNATVNETLICRRCNKESPSALCPTPENPDTGNQVAIIAGSVAGGVVLVAIVVLLVVFWWCRRKRSKGAAEMVEEPPPEISGGLRHDSSADLVTQRDKSQGDPTYENFHQKRPTNSSIQIGHDNVTRYTRDPTLKRELLNRSNPEDKELEELGEAPLPPGHRRHTRIPKAAPTSRSHVGVVTLSHLYQVNIVLPSAASATAQLPARRKGV
ncbi:uncharacterized protein LOC112561737 [Pomacea canaliculata]|uniref:uncharacterized protein LOC112561737 n=1 Tax=Pomacea canaliculata TaxID=400727 RepID=UPI000D737F5F|nr:uncharacterized protein LOC112561737 [Pomacea canaliculata]